MRLSKGLGILWQRLTRQGLDTTAWWAADHLVRIVTGANILALSRITPELHVGGQYRRRGIPRMKRRGITAVVNMRDEFDDQAAGIAFPHYLHLPTVDDQAPTLQHLRLGSAFISNEIEQGGQVYVHCGSGIGRAATMAAAYLVTSGFSAEDAWSRIREARPFIRPTPVQIERLGEFAALVASEANTVQ
jgi:protein tyrosine phosphatase (PTP) superfamily phosphohydrolase (DUF442 family)